MTSLDQNNFYVSLLSNGSLDIYNQNKHADFTVKLSQAIDLQEGSGSLRKFVFFVSRRGKPRSTLRYGDISAIPGRLHRPLRADFSALLQGHVPARV